MIKALGILAAAAFIGASVAGTVASGWFLGEALSPLRGGPIVGPLSLGMVLALLAGLVEGFRLILAWTGERIWRHSRFQALALAAPLWLACTVYCTLIPLLALAFLPVFPTGADALTILAPGWTVVQLAAGLVPGIAWVPDGGRSTAEPAIKDEAVSAIEPTRQPAVAQAPASAEDLFQFLVGLSRRPAGSVLAQRGRIGDNNEIIVSQAGLAALAGRPKPTVRRWLQDRGRSPRHGAARET